MSRRRQASAGESSKLTAKELAKKVQAFYAGAKSFTASFTQTVENKTFGTTKTSSGRVYAKKPGRMRWDYSSKKKGKGPTRVFLSNGKKLWAVFPPVREYYEASTKNVLLPAAIAFLGGKGSLLATFNVALASSKTIGADEDLVLKLTPKKANARYAALWLVLDPADYHVKASVVENSQGDKNLFEFADAQTTRRLKNSLFVFDAKKNKKYERINPPAKP